MSFAPNVDVKVFSKSAGSNLELWGVEIGGKRGYVPKTYIREYKVFTKDFKHLVNTESTASESGKVPSAPAVPKKSEIKAGSVKQTFEVVDGTTLFLSPEETISPSSTKDTLQTTALPPLVPQDNIISTNTKNLNKDTVQEVIENDLKKQVVEEELPATDSLAGKVISTLSNWLKEDNEKETSEDEEEDENNDEEEDLLDEDEEFDDEEDVTDAFQKKEIENDKQEGTRKLEEKVNNIDSEINKQISQKESNVASNVEGTEFIKQNLIELAKKMDDSNERTSENMLEKDIVNSNTVTADEPEKILSSKGKSDQEKLQLQEIKKIDATTEGQKEIIKNSAEFKITTDKIDLSENVLKIDQEIASGKEISNENNSNNSLEFQLAKNENIKEVQENEASDKKIENSVQVDSNEKVEKSSIVKNDQQTEASVDIPEKVTLSMDFKDSVQLTVVAAEKNQKDLEKNSVKNDPELLEAVTKTNNHVTVSENEVSNNNIFQYSVQTDDVPIDKVQQFSESTIIKIDQKAEEETLNTDIKDSFQSKSIAAEKDQEYIEASIKKNVEVTKTEKIVKIPENEVINNKKNLYSVWTSNDLPESIPFSESTIIKDNQNTEGIEKVPEKETANIEESITTNDKMIEALNKEEYLKTNLETNIESDGIVANTEEMNKTDDIIENENIKTVTQEIPVDENNKNKGMISEVLSLFSSAEKENYSSKLLDQLETNTVPSSNDIVNESNNVETNDDIKAISGDPSPIEIKDEVPKRNVWNILYNEPQEIFVESNKDVLISTKSDGEFLFFKLRIFIYKNRYLLIM